MGEKHETLCTVHFAGKYPHIQVKRSSKDHNIRGLDTINLEKKGEKTCSMKTTMYCVCYIYRCFEEPGFITMQQVQDSTLNIQYNIPSFEFKCVNDVSM